MADHEMQAPELVNTDIVFANAIEEQTTGFKNYYHAAKRAGQSAIVMAELLPVNEAVRLSIYGAAEAATHANNPLVGALALGLSTFAVEASAGLASASLFDTSQSKKVFESINEKAAKLKVPTERKLPQATKVWLTFMGGSVVGMALEEREDPNRTVQQNRRYAIKTSVWQGGVMAIAGAGGTELINATMENPQQSAIVGVGIAAVAAAGTGAKKLWNSRRNPNKQIETTEEA